MSGEKMRPILASELANLSDDQRDAALEASDLVVKAGPGSGKTRTLVARVGYLLETEVPNFRGIAALTYTRSAAREIAERLARLGVTPGRRLAAGTVHSWCLKSILQPYSTLLGLPNPDGMRVINHKSEDWSGLLQQSFDTAGVMDDPRYESASVTRLRRRIAAGLEVDMTDPMARAAVEVENALLRHNWIDFDAMVSRSLVILKEHPKVSELVISRYPHLIVDEYQDMGPVLHQIIVTLRQHYGARVSAFGDADQTVMGFTGADPIFLEQLSQTPGFVTIPLRLNYRCGQAIVAASHAALAEERPYVADPRRTDKGVIEPVHVAGGLARHAEETTKYLKTLIASGVPAHQIAVIYPGKGYLLECLTRNFERNSLGFVHENDEILPEDDVIDFLKACIVRATAGFQISSAESIMAQNVSTLRELSRFYDSLRRRNGLPPLTGRTSDRLIAEVCAEPMGEGSAGFINWMAEAVKRLELNSVADGSAGSFDRLLSFLTICQDSGLTVSDVTARDLRQGKFTLTTYHGAKGREWDVVILPGLVEGVMPGRRYHARTRSYPATPPDRLAQDIRSFYVGLTRARNSVVMIYGDYFDNRGGYTNSFGPSRFVLDVLAHLRSG